MNHFPEMPPPDDAGRRPDFRGSEAELRERAEQWTQSAVFARLAPHAPAIISRHGTRTMAQLHADVNRLAHALRERGLRPGDGVAIACGNRPEYVEALLAALRLGLRVTPISTRLTGAETAWIVSDCQAKVLFVEQGLPAQGLGVAPEIVIGSHDYAAELARGSAEEVADACAGALMLYTSGTTGRPKGVWSAKADIVPPQFGGSFANYQPGDVQLCAGPAYHAAPLLFDLRWPLASGVPIVLLDKWDSTTVLDAIHHCRVTHAHMVPTMFQRLLALPPAERAARDLHSLRCLMHGAAPCPVQVKRAMIDWLGPVLLEYYAATEGGDGIHVRSEDWLARPGTVGRLERSRGHRILDESGQEVAAGVVGTIYFQAPAEGRFEYFGDPEKTAAAYKDNRFTLGDLGYVDEDGWLFLTGRCADVVISGGVNLYPAEVDEALMQHPGVEDACTVGVPDADWGEHLLSVVVPRAPWTGGGELMQSLTQHLEQHLPRLKRPKEIVFETALPRTETGKLLRNRVRARFWEGIGRSI